MERLINVQPKQPKLYLFVDDIDFLDRDMFPTVTSHLKPFLMSRACCVILAARKPAENAIRQDDDFMIGQFFDKTTISLSHLEISSLIRERIHATTRAYESETDSANVFRRFWEGFRELITDDSNYRINTHYAPLPFTPKQLTFIQDCSNGNIRLMMEYARKFLAYMAKHERQLERDSFDRIVIGRDRLVDGLGGASESNGIRIHNLHERQSYRGVSKAERKRLGISKSDIGNSLYVLLLETLRDYRTLNETQLGKLQGFGFSMGELKEGVAELYSKVMIEETLLEDRRALGERAALSRDYELTRRGHYYIDYLIHWDEYIARCGRSRHHEAGTAANANEFITRTLLQFVAAIGSAIPMNPRLAKFDRWKISKEAFTATFCRLGSECLIWANWNDKVSPIEVDISRVQSVLSNDLDIIETHGLESARSFVFHMESMRNRCSERRIAWRLQVPFFDKDIVEFVEHHVFCLDEDVKA